jgi:hypothetical protein
MLLGAAVAMLLHGGTAAAAGTCGGPRQPACANISDGAAKGQATERTYQPGAPGGTHPPPGMAVKGSGVPQNTTVQMHPHPRSVDQASPQ